MISAGKILEPEIDTWIYTQSVIPFFRHCASETRARDCN